MESSASSRRKLLPFVPDVPYHIQGVFLLTFGYIWHSAFSDAYLEDISGKTPKDLALINVSSSYFQ